jgi:6-phosphogluconolactonase
VEAVEVPLEIPRRLTLTLPVLNKARRTIILITGAEKSARVREILDGRDRELPAALIDPDEGECLWLLDHEAALEMR